jgi:O-antigen ligase
MLCMAVAAWDLATRGRSILEEPARDTIIFWLCAWVLLPCGVIWGLVSGRSTPDYMAHDVFALAFTGTATIAFVILLSQRLRWSSLSFAYIVCAAYPLALLWLIVPSSGVFGPLQPWLGDRFQGWAENPNQLATLMQPAPLLIFALWRERPGFFRKAFLVVTFGVAVAVGLATKSDALWVSWVAGALALVGLIVRRAIVDRTQRMTLSRAAATSIFAMFATIVIFVAVIFGIGTVVQLGQNVSSSDNNQGPDRFTLWGNAVAAIIQSPIVGFGPGGFSGHSGPFEKMEAHNSLLDWGMATGALGIITFLYFITRALGRAMRARSVLPGAALMSLLVFASFHYTFRQPMFWLGLVLVTMMPSVAQRNAGPDSPAGPSEEACPT